MDLKMHAEKKSKVFRNIIQIDETLCNGCALCISPCAEGAIEIINGKAKVISEDLCDGLGACLGICPTGALTIEKKETVAFNEEKALRRQKSPMAENESCCFLCGKTDQDSYLIPARKNGQTRWICTRCLPSLIHK